MKQVSCICRKVENDQWTYIERPSYICDLCFVKLFDLFSDNCLYAESSTFETPLKKMFSVYTAPYQQTGAKVRLEFSAFLRAHFQSRSVISVYVVNGQLTETSGSKTFYNYFDDGWKSESADLTLNNGDMVGLNEMLKIILSSKVAIDEI